MRALDHQVGRKGVLVCEHARVGHISVGVLALQGWIVPRAERYIGPLLALAFELGLLAWQHECLSVLHFLLLSFVDPLHMLLYTAYLLGILALDQA